VHKQAVNEMKKVQTVQINIPNKKSQKRKTSNDSDSMSDDMDDNIEEFYLVNHADNKTKERPAEYIAT
jgi:hypothetical protein